MELNRIVDESKKGFRSAASWALIFSFSANAQKKNNEHLRVQLEVLRRLKAAKLEVACLVNSTHTQVHVLLSAGLERLESEAEKAELKKQVRCNGGLAKFTCTKRHLFGPLVLDETRFFSSVERQELIMRIVMSNPRFAGAAVDIKALQGGYSPKNLEEMLPGKLAHLATLLSGGEPQGPATHRSQERSNGAEQVRILADKVVQLTLRGPFLLDVMPLHHGHAQQELALAFAGWWFFRPPPLDRSSKSSLLDILQQSLSDPRGAATQVSRVPLHDAVRDYLGESHAIYFEWLAVLALLLVPLVLASLVLFAMHNSTSPLNIENALLGIVAMVWINKYAAQWRRRTAHLHHRWGQSNETREMAELSLRSACAQDRHMQHHEELTPDTVRDSKATRRNRAIVQLVLLGTIGLVSIGIYLLVRWSRSYIFGEPTTAVQVLSMSLIDVARIYLMQFVGRQLLSILSQWDDDIASAEDKAAWQLSKYLFFEICNNFCSLFISIGYQAFSAGTDWKFVEAPSCFDDFCQLDLEVHIWTIVGVKYLVFPTALSLYNYWTFSVIRSRLRSRRLHGTSDGTSAVGNARKAAQGALAHTQQTTGGKTIVVQPTHRGIEALLFGCRGPARPMTLETDEDGTFGETPVETQLLLRPYDPYDWEVRRPLDVVMLIAFIGLCSTLAPLLPLAGIVFISLKQRLEALELLVTTRRPPCSRNQDMNIWNEAVSFIGLLSVFCTSIAIMFATPDVDALISRLADNYRTYLSKNPEFNNGVTCMAGICLDSKTQKAEGSLYWIIWICIIAIGLATRALFQLVFRTPSLWMLRHEQVESDVQSLLGLGAAHTSEDETALVLEEFMARYNKVSIDPTKFERPPC